MWSLLLKRVIAIIPMLIVVSMFFFFLIKASPHDEVDAHLESQGISFQGDQAMDQNIYNQTKIKLGLQLPYFYFSIVPNHYPAQLNALVDPDTEADIRRELKHKKGFFPKIIHHGIDNQFHHFIHKLMKGSFGISRVDGKPVSQKISSSFAWTIAMVIPTLLLSILCSIILGFYQAFKVGSRFERWSSKIADAIYIIPIFLMASLLLVFFTTREYGTWTNIFPTVDIIVPKTDSTWSTIAANWQVLLLPTIILTIHNIGYLSKQIKVSILNEKNKPYFNALRAKGTSRTAIFKNHLLTNSLVPLITIITGVIPGLLAGSVVVEEICNVPGMGRLLYQSIINADWELSLPIVLLLAIIAVISFLIGDMLYRWVNPKIQLTA